MDKKPEYLNAIYETLEREVTKAVKMVAGVVYTDSYGHKQLRGSTYKDLRLVLTIDESGNIVICNRVNKSESMSEICLLRKKQIREGGFSSAYWDIVVEKVASALEGRGLIKERKVYREIYQNRPRTSG